MRVRRIGFFRGGRTKGRVIDSLPRCKDGGTAAQAAVVIDHTEAACETKPRFRHLGAERLSADLPHDLDQAEKAAGGAGLSDRQLAARGVERKRTVGGEAFAAHEI